jgi:solute carrier family 25 carnitine/acylcarnitine transporter 20/29
LLGTELREVGLGGGRQKLPVSVNAKGGKLQEGSSGNGEVGFGGGMVIGEPVEIQGSIIYLLSKLLEPPPDAIEAILPSSTLSTFLTSVFASSLDDTVRFSRSSTILVPQNDAFQDLGLLTTHLLLPEARRDLGRVIKHHILTSVLYESELGNGTTGTHGTLEGSDVRLTDGFITSSGEWGVFGKIDPKNVLTKTGVVHQMDRVLIPRSVKVNVGDLARAAKGFTMAGLVTRSGLGGILNGTLSLDDVEGWDGWRAQKVGKDRDSKGQATGWILLCPTDEAFRTVNLTRLLGDMDATKRFVMQHIVPTPPNLPSSTEGRQRDPWASYPIPFIDDSAYNTLLAPDDDQHSDITFRYPDNRSDRSVYVGIKNIRGSLGSTEFAKILSYGRTTTHGPRGGVIMIDRVLDPYVSGWWGAWGAAAATGTGGVLVIVALWFWWHYWWHSWSEEATYEPLDAGDTEDP